MSGGLLCVGSVAHAMPLLPPCYPPTYAASASIDTPIGTASSSWSTQVPNGNCGTVPENSVLNLTCVGGTFTGVAFASFGTPQGECPHVTAGRCVCVWGGGGGGE